MIRKTGIITAVLAVFSALVLCACSRTGGDDGTGSVTTGGTGEEAVRNDKTEFVLKSKTTESVISVKNGVLSLSSLKTESGKENTGAPTDYALPEAYETGASAKKKFDWVYRGYSVYTDGKGGSGYRFIFDDGDAGAEYDVYAVVRADMPGPVELFGYLTNKGNRAMTLMPGAFFRASTGGDKVPVAWTFNKESGTAEGWKVPYNNQLASGSGIYQTELTQGNTASAYSRVNQNWNDSGAIPMMYLDYGGSGVYFALEWTNGKLSATGMKNNGAVLSVCLYEQGFRTQIPAGAVFYLPSVYIGAYDGDVDIGSNIFKHWFLRYKAPSNLLEDKDEPLTQEDMQLGYDVAKYGIQQIKWDYGWWSDEIVTGQWRTNEGLLEVRNSAYLGVLKSAGCTTLKRFVSKANKAGVKLTLYILLKDTQLDQPGLPTSVGRNGHPEWFSNICITGVGNSADLGNEECVEFYKQYLGDFFKKNGVTTWRSDFEPICRESDKKNRHFAGGNDVQYWCTVGFGELVDYLSENVDGFRYESCSSGGSMKDFFTMSKASVIQCEDASEFMSAHITFYDSSYCIPAAQLQLPVNALTYTPGSEYYSGIGDYLYGFRCTLTGAVMLSSWGGASQEDISYWDYYIKNLYNTVMKPLIKYGDLYHILPRPDGIHWDGLEYIDTDSENEIKGMVLLWKPTDTEGAEKTVYLRGLDEKTTYNLKFEDRPEQNCTKTGAELMKKGLTVRIEGQSGSEMIWISEAK